MSEAKKTVGKIKKKQWFELVAPKIFRNVSLGQTLVSDRNQLIGKEVKTSLANITGDIKRQSTIIKFKVSDVKENKAITEIIGYNILLTYLKRMARKGRNKVDVSFVCKTKDDKRVKVKMILITRNIAKNKVQTSLRKVGKNILTNAIKNMSYSNLINDVISYTLQRSLRDQLKKVFPLKICEIRYISLMQGKRTDPQESKKKQEPAETKDSKDTKEQGGGKNAKTDN